jgi:hypothetical protein
MNPKKRCYVCRSPSRLRPSGPDPTIQVCPTCFSSASRVLELERREDCTYENLIEAVAQPKRSIEIVKKILASGYGESDVVYNDALAKARAILRDVAYDLQPKLGNTHAATPIIEQGETFFACSMPGCKLCALSSRASSFLEDQGWIY